MFKNLKEKIKDYYYYSCLSVVIQWLTSLLFLVSYFHLYKKTTIKFVGAKPNPQQNYIVVSNHRSYDDPPLLGYSIGQPVAFVAKKELFTNPFLYLFMILTSTISVDRENPESQTFRAAKKALSSKSWNKAWCLGMFIEGTRSKSPDSLGKPQKGPIFLARLCRVPIIPMGITYKDNNKTLIVNVGEPYKIDYKGDLDEQAWQCLEKISKLTDYKMPIRTEL